MDWVKKRLCVGFFVAIILALAACGGAGGGSARSSETRTVEHAVGETETEGTPERVAVLDTGELDSAMSSV